MFRCEEPLSSPGVSKSISEGIIEEEEEEEEECESNHKRKKEDDQEVVLVFNIKTICQSFYISGNVTLVEIWWFIIMLSINYSFFCTFSFYLELQIKKESLYTWRIELSKTEKYWEGWFKGLSSLFLSCPVPKLLLLAGKRAEISLFYIMDY